ncbi:MAG: HAD family phosphatase [Firmicutes bacterium]|nr:HAD family phosphatase [Bacillota bacterium]
MIRLIAADLDDTLLDRNSILSRENKEAVKEVLERGIMFTIATGRMFAATVKYARELNLPSHQPIICFNGALIQRLSGEIIYERPLSVDLAAAIVQFGQKRGWSINAYYRDKLYVSRLNQKIEEYVKFVGVPAREVGDLAGFIKGGKRLSKLLVIGDPQKMPALVKKMRKLFGAQAKIAQSQQKFMEITALEAHKGAALIWLARFMGFKRTEVMAIGDSNNDVTMLEAAEIGVAVSNAVEEAKKAAQYQTGAHYEHGVAQAIRRHILGFPDVI